MILHSKLSKRNLIPSLKEGLVYLNQTDDHSFEEHYVNTPLTDFDVASANKSPRPGSFSRDLSRIPRRCLRAKTQNRDDRKRAPITQTQPGGASFLSTCLTNQNIDSSRFCVLCILWIEDYFSKEYLQEVAPE
ncbi:hypothetical protein AVEN_212940-1 [Araneus ventricosus]|uniref:Uncharacterized protein n=1 Tax=Araneus ventricosus TaxID=182803 RepID=A0A4Y2I321_ARAVE|nr:hypothetical protein AVEN_212940-1 [Araneus ventricosus]